MDDDRNREGMDQLLANLFAALPRLEQLLERADRCDDRDVKGLTDVVDAIIGALESVAPGKRLSAAGIESMRPAAPAGTPRARAPRGTGAHAVQPFMQCFRQARFYLELAILCGRAGRALPRDLSDATAVLARLFEVEWPAAPVIEAPAKRPRSQRLSPS